MRLHQRLRNMRDQAIRRPDYRPVYAHALTIAHMNGRMTTDDHPAWARIETAFQSLRSGDQAAIDVIEREIARLWDKPQ